MVLIRDGGGGGATARVPVETTAVVRKRGATQEASFPDGATATATGGSLVVQGTKKGDQIGVEQTANGLRVNVNGAYAVFPGSFSSVAIRGAAGNDGIWVDDSVQARVRVDGGRGGDTIRTRNQDAYVQGGGGNDWVDAIGRRAVVDGAERGAVTSWGSDQAGRSLDVTTAGYTLLEELGEDQALQTVITARGGDPGSHVGDVERGQANRAIQEALGLPNAATAEQLRDVDHWLNAYGAAHDGPFSPDEGDGFFARTAKTAARSAVGVAQAGIVVGYTAGKAIAQHTPVDPIDLIPGTDFKGRGPNVSDASVSEVVQGLKGVFHGVYDDEG